MRKKSKKSDENIGNEKHKKVIKAYKLLSDLINNPKSPFNHSNNEHTNVLKLLMFASIQTSIQEEIKKKSSKQLTEK